MDASPGDIINLGYIKFGCYTTLGLLEGMVKWFPKPANLNCRDIFMVLFDTLVGHTYVCQRVALNYENEVR